jgi:hypothetical protein
MRLDLGRMRQSHRLRQRVRCPENVRRRRRGEQVRLQADDVRDPG